jgi:hypothetical protein
MEAIRSSETSVYTISNSTTSQKMAFFIVTAVKTSNVTELSTNSNIKQFKLKGNI